MASRLWSDPMLLWFWFSEVAATLELLDYVRPYLIFLKYKISVGTAIIHQVLM